MKKSFFYGTMVLIVAGAITKIFGFAHRIILSQLIGSEGMGLYQMIVPLLYFLITITTFGLPVAIAKQVAEAEAAKNHQQSRRFLYLALAITIGLSTLVSLLLAVGARFFTELFFTDSRTHLLLLTALPILPIASFSAVLRGYFQGKQNMVPTALSQLIEQIVRILIVIGMTLTLAPYGIFIATIGAVGSILLGELAGLLYMIWNYKKNSRELGDLFKRPGSRRALFQKSSPAIKQLLHVSLPVTMSRVVGSIAYVMEPMLVPYALLLAGYKTVQATSLYGQFSGMAVPLLLFPTFLTYSLSISMVPAVAEAAFEKNSKMVHRRIYQAMRITLVIGAPCAVLLYVFAEPLCQLLYKQAEVGLLLKQLAPFSVFLFFQAPLAAALQGLDQAHVVFRNTLIGTVVKIASMFILTSRPEFGINGAIIALNLNITLVTMLHFASLVKGIGFTIQVGEFVKIGFAMLAIGYCSTYMSEHWFKDTSLLHMLTICSSASMLLYLVLLVSMRVLGKQDVARIPWIGQQLSMFFPRR
ncbi:stage V sporulation protein B [Brevibacillus laterosporus]|uniref:stage V sporulation protein B n=1 Tax=Brevibacillus laterosporus TaxID=1465 RepID=UPI00265512E0|nr:stage V sporulation protein B [Brevibacillus laterosporus]MDN9010808.1 stage V sporulation protein B [Brevibacillus laterosporus]MDO0941831.1 stage V sporulation protein B [Brevibacillus laterosporus]